MSDEIKVAQRRRQRQLNRRDVVHASGWIREVDQPAFDALVDRAKPIVEEVDGNE